MEEKHEHGDAPGAVTIKPYGRPADYSLTIPGSKSLANRALLLAAVAEGPSAIDCLPDSGDIRAALDVLSGLGLTVAGAPPGAVRIEGRGPGFPVREGDLNLRSSGTVGRFLPGLLAAAPSGKWRLTATEQLAARPLAPLLEALRQWGADIVPECEGRSFPLLVAGGGLSGGTAEISAAASSQFASGLLLAAPLARGPARVVIRDLSPDEAYIDMTLDLMRRFGVDAASVKAGTVQTVDVRPRPYRGAEFAVEADYNSALYFLCLPLLVGGTARVTNLSLRSGQPGRQFLTVLERLGATVGADAGVSVSGCGLPLKGGFDIDMRAMSEMAVTLGVLAVFADAPVIMTNLLHIRGHETDRLDALATLLSRVGAMAEQGRDWIRVHPVPAARIRNTIIDSMDDHRLAMSFSLLGLAANGLTIARPEAVGKTFPDFFRRLRDCGADITGSV